MKILLVNYRYFLSGGPERYMFNIKNLLEKKGHEVFPFSVHSSKNVATDFEKYFVEPIGGRDAVYYAEVKKTPRSIFDMLDRCFYSFGVKKAIQKEIADVKPDVVYIIHFVNKLSPSVIRGAKEMGVPIVLRLSDYFLLCPRFDFLYDNKVCEKCLTHGYRYCIKRRCVKGSFFASLVRVLAMRIHGRLRIYDDVDAFISPSQFLKDKLVGNGFKEDKIKCIPSFTSGESEAGTQIVGDYGLFFGRIVVEKGIETIIKAYEQMPERRVLIMGDDSTNEAKRMKNYVVSHSMHNVEFVGFKSGIEMEEIVKNARFTMIPSLWYDNLPNAALESFRYSKPVIASSIGSFPELVIDGVNGFLINPNSTFELVEKIKILDDDNVVLQMGNANKKRLEEFFSEGNHYNGLMEIFKEVLDRD